VYSRPIVGGVLCGSAPLCTFDDGVSALTVDTPKIHKVDLYGHAQQRFGADPQEDELGFELFGAGGGSLLHGRRLAFVSHPEA